MAHFAELEHERLKPVDDGLLDVPLAQRRRFTEIEELQDERVLDHIFGLADLLVTPRQRGDFVGAAVLGELLEPLRADLALELSHHLDPRAASMSWNARAVSSPGRLLAPDKRTVTEMVSTTYVGPPSVGGALRTPASARWSSRSKHVPRRTDLRRCARTRDSWPSGRRRAGP